MNNQAEKVNDRVRPETRFELRPAPPAPFRANLENEFERLKNRLLAETLDQAEQPELNVPLRRAANEAAALAWVTFYPLLVFPVLFEEKTAPPCARPPTAGAHLRRTAAKSSPNENAHAQSGGSWPVTAVGAGETDLCARANGCTPRQICWGTRFGARTDFRQGISSVRLRQYCPRS